MMHRWLCLVLAIGALMAVEARGAEQDTLVFIREDKDALGQPNMILERIQADGSGRSVIFDSALQENPEPIPFPKWQRSPDISPLGKKILLRRSWTLSAMNWDGSGAVNLTPYRREWYDPRWSPDGRQIALCADLTDFAEVYLIDFDGGNLRNLTWKAKSNERSPDWSPDGGRICFISDRNGKFELFTMKADDGSEQTRLLSLEGDIREPDWGPHNRLAFALQKPDGTSAIYVVDADGKNLTQLTKGDCWDGQVRWDAEGQRLAFVSNRSGEAEIWVMELASRKLSNVTRNPAQNELFPTWVPKQLADAAPVIPSNEGQASNIAGLQLPRPRLLFRVEDLPGIRDQLAQEPRASVWKTFLSNCDTLLDPESAASKRVEASIAAIQNNPPQGLYDRSAWIKPVFDLAFARQVTGERRYGERAAAWLLRIAEEYARWHQDMVSEYPVACAYDWLYDLFSPEDLRMLTGLLQTTAQQSYEHVVDSYFGETNLIACNFATHDAGSVGPIYLALAGEPGSNSAWLPTAARLTTVNLNTWIGPAGDAAEGTSYFNTPIHLLMPFMISLKINDLYPETRESNLRKFADWYAIVNAGDMLPSIGDSDGGTIIFPVGLLRLYPDNLTARKLWNSIARPEAPTPEVLSLLWFEPSENQPQDYTGLPRTAYFESQNYQVFRSGYSEDSCVLTFNLSAGGHSHMECGALALTAFGEKLLVDPGQAVNAADCHSQLLINGQGRFENYVTLASPRERISPIQAGEVAAGSSVNMVPAFRTREVSTHSSGAYSLPGPGVALRHGSRTLVMVGDDITVVPPYYLVYDDVQVNDEASLYEQLYIGDADVIVREHGAGALVLARRYTGPWLTPVSGAQGEARLEFDLPEAGNYQVWIYLRGRYGPFAFRLGPHTRNTTVGARTTRENCWQWVPAGPALALEAGRQTLAVLPRAMIFAQVALIPEAQAQTYAGWGDLPEGSLARSCSEAVISGESWKLESPARPAAELLVASLNRDRARMEADTFSFRTRFYRQVLMTLPRGRLVKRQPEANFLTLIYPYLPGMEQPQIRREARGAVLAWEKATDTVQVTPKELVVRRQHRDGKEEVFRYQRPIFQG